MRTSTRSVSLRRDSGAFLPRRQRRAFRRTVEHLEERCLLSTAGTVTPGLDFGGGGPGGGFGGGGSAGGSTTTILGSTTPYANTPTSIASYYNYTGALAQNGGTGTTIAIVDAYNDPNIATDLATFDTPIKNPTTGAITWPGVTGTGTLTVVNQNGQVITNPATTKSPATDTSGDWELEESLDVEWAHAMAPNANILLIEANSDLTSDLSTAIGVANANGPGSTSLLPALKGAPVVAVSMSWGGGSPGTATFSTPGITYFASSGDSGPGASWPASSPNVVGVGGTDISGSVSSSNNETAWDDSGGGASTNPLPPYQQSYASTTGNEVLGSTRGVPDVSYDANPYSGVSVVDTYAWTSGRNKDEYDWIEVGGTSVGSPQWAAIAADADSLRITAAGGVMSGNAPVTLTGSTQFLPAIYALASNSTTYSSDFTDITMGSSSVTTRGKTTTNTAGNGYDYVTGLGSPNVTNLVSALVSVTGSQTSAGNTLGFAKTASPSSTPPAVAIPSDILFVPITLFTPPGTTTSTPAPGSSSTTSPTPTPTPTPGPGSSSSSSSSGTVIVVTLPFASLLNVNTSGALVLINAQNQLGLTATANTAQVHTAASNGTEAGVAASSLVATTSIPVLPPQPLFRAPASDRGPAAPRFFEEPPPFAPLDWTSPALNWDFVSRGGPVDPLDLIAIAEHAAALGRVADVADGPAAQTPVAVPVTTDLNVRETTPTLDPVLAGAVITLSGALALHTSRSNSNTNSRGRRWPTFRPGP